ncbi:helix-turn-helix domain-containing protein [Shinella pollutisoli]|uniref:Helix-turn-helix domain-containing protein n=1 Tax=Shinella pollutisoli TaxID=2250594 RepID=A0ABV7DDR7_9HYPH|nr:helix-turn-helix transcriptional regulator [Shinella pollutisoli]
MTFSGESNTIPFPVMRTDSDTLGGRIWRARDALGLTLADLAARLGLPEETVGEWECDRAEPRADALARLAGVLSVAPSWLVAGIGGAPSLLPDGDEMRLVHRHLDAVRRLHEETGEAIAALEAEIARLAGRSRG